MVFLVKVQVKLETLKEFGHELQRGSLDNTRVRGETWCLRDQPAVGYSVWETEDRRDFDARFGQWRRFYDAVEVSEVITPKEAMAALLGQLAQG